MRLAALPQPAGWGRSRTIAALLLALVGCAGSDREPEPGGGELSGEVRVFAAASLTEAFTQIAEAFEQAHPGVDVTLNLGSSSALAQQILAGAPADVFAAASPATMATVTETGDAVDPLVFARNSLQIAVPPGNPGAVTGLTDFADEELVLALCAEQVPCGAAAAAVLDSAGVRAAPDTFEQDVKAALSKVRLGEVDAALVYRTDVLAAGDDVEGIGFPEAAAAVNDYPIAVLADAPAPAAAAAFSSFVLSDPAQSLLADAGFARP